MKLGHRNLVYPNPSKTRNLKVAALQQIQMSFSIDLVPKLWSQSMGFVVSTQERQDRFESYFQVH